MFYLKEFSIEDSGATMKVGNDAILLGAMVEPKKMTSRILDVGTGCGILALMMAQRFPNAQITAIDIDTETIEVAAANFAKSRWSDRLDANNITLQEFAGQSHTSYDLIISNPPYFSNSLRNTDLRRRIARHDDTLSLNELFSYSRQLLSPNGTLSIILPISEFSKATTAALESEMFLHRQTNICNHHDDPPKRTILQFSVIRSPLSVKPYSFCLRNTDNSYSTEYRTVTEPFLL
ncbi:MAG: methyltransferase [Bacteroidales bacterium]|nr:methyltransferase [Bacteroidales bacterium]